MAEVKIMRTIQDVKMNKTTIKKYYRKKLATTTNPTFEEINKTIVKNVRESIAQKYDEAWVELAK